MHDGFVQLYQERLKQTPKKKVRPRGFQETLCQKYTIFPTRVQGHVDA